MRVIVLIFSLLVSITVFSYDITIDENQKVLSTFSGDINHQQGFQAVLTKNKNKNTFDIIPFLIDESGTINQLSKVSFQKKVSILSYHLNDGVLSVLVKEKKNKKKSYLKLIDFNIKTKAYAVTELDDSLSKHLLRLENQTISFHKTGDELYFVKIINGKQIIKKQILIKDTIILKTFSFDYFSAINTHEYVENGSTALNNLYIYNDYFYFVNLDKKENTTHVLRFDFNNLDDYKSIDVKNNTFDKIKDFNTYMYKNDIITVVSGKKDMIIKITDFDTETSNFKVSGMKELVTILDNEKLNEFIKKTSKTKYHPTITANNSVDNHIVINVSYVERTYSYSYDWWFMNWTMQQQMMQQQMMNTMPSFGPNVQEVLPFINTEKKKMQFVIDANYKILKSASTKTQYKDIDTDGYLEDYKDDSSKKWLTAAFTNNNYFIIYFDKQNRKIRLEKKNYYNLN